MIITHIVKKSYTITDEFGCRNFKMIFSYRVQKSFCESCESRVYQTALLRAIFEFITYNKYIFCYWKLIFNLQIFC